MTHPDFDLLEQRRLEELNSEASLWRHRATGLELLSISNDDRNKVFGVAFRTPPEDSTGIAHILEHSVLCGSTKYPLKDPFVQLLKGSVQTFLNAMTYPDKTVYPVASQNLKDFYNLADVYMDAVFHPLLTPEKLEQEGWHVHLAEDGTSLRYQGVVYNEMKGVYSSPDSLAMEKSQQILFPDTTYGLDSGGDPEHIPELTFEQFEGFHQRYYHPSNARVFFWGDDDPLARLDFLAERLAGYEAIEPRSEVPLQSRFAAPRSATFCYPAGPEDGNRSSLVTVNWLLPPLGDTEFELSLGILAHILVGATSSPLRRALIESGLGDDVIGHGLEGDLRQILFSTGLRGVREDQAEEVEQLVLDTLRRMADEGPPADQVEASLNTVEFALRENNTGSYPRGLVVFLRALGHWLHGLDALAPLAFEAPLEGLKQRLASGEPVFQNLIREHWLENPHRVRMLLRPDPDEGQRRERSEREALERVRSGLDEKGLAALAQRNQRLEDLQRQPDAPEDLARIPVLAPADLEKRQELIPCQVGELADVPCLASDVRTFGVAYIDLSFRIAELPAEDVPYAALLGDLLFEIGTRSQDYVSLNQRIGAHTGGLSSSLFAATHEDGRTPVPCLQVHGKSLPHQVQEMGSILADVLLQSDFREPSRVRQVMQELRSGMEAHMVPGGHRVVRDRLMAGLDAAGWYREQMEGISFLLWLRALLAEGDDPVARLAPRLASVASKVFTRRNLVVNMTCDEECRPAVQAALRELVASLPEGQAGATLQPSPTPACELLAAPSQVHYVGKAARLAEDPSSLSGSDLVVTRYLRTAWLWEQIRVLGGAYGAFGFLDMHNAAFAFVSYRDPHVDRTLDIYNRTAAFLRELDLSAEELQRAIVGAVGDLDRYQLPDAKGRTALARHLLGTSDERLQQVRDEVLSTGTASFSAFGEKLEAVSRNGVEIVLGPENLVKGEAFLSRNNPIITRVL